MVRKAAPKAKNCGVLFLLVVLLSLAAEAFWTTALLSAGSSSRVFGVVFCIDETVVAIAGTMEVLAKGLSLPLLCLTVGSLVTPSVDTFDNGYETSSFLTT